MKKKILLIYLAFCCVLFAQGKMYIHKSDNVTLGVPLSSISWKSNNDSLVVSAGSVKTSIPITQIDSISFADDSDTIRINFSGNSVSITNPLAFEKYYRVSSL